MIRRNITINVQEALDDTPVVLVVGARQSGKSTLAQALASGSWSAQVYTLDDAATHTAAASDPQGFISGLQGPVVLDEVQRVPELFVAIKAAVDRDRTPGRFLLTGSANVMMLPDLAQELAGRMEVIELQPFSQGELEGRSETFIDRSLSHSFLAEDSSTDLAALRRRALKGGYPEAVARATHRRRDAWFAAYISTLLQREVRELAQVDRLYDLPRLARLVAARSGGLHNAAELSRTLGLAQTTLRRYLGLLEATFVLRRVPAWSANLSKRLVRSPKLYLRDSGLLSHLAGYTEDRLELVPEQWGALFEAFVVAELFKQLGWSDAQPSVSHFRTHGGAEVDLVMEDATGRLVAIEIKARSSVRSADFRGIRKLRQDTSNRFVRGFVVYTGREVVRFEPDLIALPVFDLWS